MPGQQHVDATRTALLVMDYQVGLVQRLPDSHALLERVNTAISEIRVLQDACADPDPATHDFLTRVIYPRHTEVIDVAELPARFS